MADFETVLERYASVPEALLGEAWTWPGHAGARLQVRDALFRSLELEQVALTRAGLGPSEAAGAAALAQMAFGDLRGLLCGQPDDLLDLACATEGWTLRQALRHVLTAERRYRLQVGHALRRSDDEPVYQEFKVEVDAGGGTSECIARLAAEREASRELTAIPDAALGRPTIWAGFPVDVRFRLHRFASHLAEHTIQCEKILAGLGRPDAEARRLARRISATRGAHEWLTDPATLSALNRDHEQLAASIPR